MLASAEMSDIKWNVVGLCAALVVGCGAPSRNSGGDDDGVDSGPHGGDGNGDNCSEAAKKVYTVDQNNQLSTFDATTKTFHDIGRLSCNASFGATPFSMGIDRSATAYVLYSSGQLFRVDTTSLACTPTSWSSQLGLQQYGMGFSTDVAGGSTDTLFIAGGSTGVITNPTSTMARLDVNTMMASSVGTVTGWPELTGTGNAELWGFFPDASATRVEQLNKASGAGLKTYQAPALAGTPAAWAFAFWGGDFWIFLMKNTETATTVYQMNGMTGAITGSTPFPGRTIVGAGVSTCAPTVIF